jgi:hypothetical protein
LCRTTEPVALKPGDSCFPERAGKKWVKRLHPIRMKKLLEKRERDLFSERDRGSVKEREIHRRL